MTKSVASRALLVPMFAAACTLAACGGSNGGNGGSNGGGATETRSDKVRITTPAVSTGDATTLASDDRHFALDLYQQARMGSTDNLVFSPASISIALAMAYGGAAGTTASQMATALHFSLPAERLHPAFDALDLALESPPAAASDAGAFQLSLANAVWGQQGFTILPAYLDLLAQDYGAGLQVVDFGANQGETARLTINQWVSDKTAAKIPNLIPAHVLDASTRLVLTNAVYFKADWQSPFDPMSPMGTFNAPTGPVQVPMMSGHDMIVPSWSGAGYHAAALPYKGGATSMVVVVPDAGTFDAFEAGLTAASLDTILTASPTGNATVTMPRFKFSTTLGLATALQALGMTDAFSAASADFSGIDGAHDLFIQAVLHQALIAVDEKGTEAAAATAITIGTAAVFVGEQLTIDRPFLFAIRDDATGAIVFLGRVLDPSK